MSSAMRHSIGAQAAGLCGRRFYSGESLDSIVCQDTKPVFRVPTRTQYCYEGGAMQPICVDVDYTSLFFPFTAPSLRNLAPLPIASLVVAVLVLVFLPLAYLCIRGLGRRRASLDDELCLAQAMDLEATQPTSTEA